jgi:prepilin peptidase CpaA
MGLFSLENWPLLVVSVAMIVAAVIDGYKLKVPNWLTFPLILSGWALGLFYTVGHQAGFFDAAARGGLGASLAGTALGFALLLPVYAIGGMGAGDVKMQMGFGAWVGAFYPLFGTDGHPGSLWVIFVAFCIAVLVGGIIATGQILVRGQFKQNLQNTREILGDLLKSSGLGEVADRAQKRKPRLHLLPYGIPLCIGFVGYLVYLNAF